MQRTPEENDEILSTLMLSRWQGLTQSQALALIDYYGSARAAVADTHPANSTWATLRADRYAMQTARDAALREMDFCDEHHIRVLPCTSSDYPLLLQSSEVIDRPLQLFSCGCASLNRRHIISVVGTRNISEYGKQVCEKLMSKLAKKIPDLLVISGLAYGVDIHAHRACLVNNIDTAAVLAHGLDRIYPRNHRATAEQMVLHGALLTEYFSGTVPDKGNFVRRNRIVAGMSSATLVVESAEQGGSLITARIADSYNRDVLAVPGRITDTTAVGCNNLIRRNVAQLVTSADDILDALNWKAEANVPQERQLFPEFSVEQEKVLGALRGADDMSIDQLSQALQMSLSQLTDILFDLEDKDAVKRMPGNRYRVRG